jgi:hypothetical protein
VSDSGDVDVAVADLCEDCWWSRRDGICVDCHLWHTKFGRGERTVATARDAATTDLEDFMEGGYGIQKVYTTVVRYQST